MVNVSGFAKGVVDLLPSFAKTAAKNTDNVAKTAVKAADDVVGEAAKNAAKNALKGADDVVDGAEAVAKNALKGADDVVDGAEAVAKNAAKSSDEVLEGAEAVAKNAAKKVDDAAVEAAKKATKKKYIIGGVLVLGAAGATAAGAESIRKNNIKFNITKIEDASTVFGEAVTRITYSPSEQISKKDSITISDSTCYPNIDGAYNIEKIINTTQLEIKTQDKISTKGIGNMRMYTNVATQLEEGAKAAAGAAGGVIGGATGGLLSGFFDSIIPGSGSYMLYAIIASIVLCSSSLVVFLIMNRNK